MYIDTYLSTHSHTLARTRTEPLCMRRPVHTHTHRQTHHTHTHTTKKGQGMGKVCFAHCYKELFSVFRNRAILGLQKASEACT